MLTGLHPSEYGGIEVVSGEDARQEEGQSVEHLPDTQKRYYGPPETMSVSEGELGFWNNQVGA